MMPKPLPVNCEHTCRGLCTALEIAMLQEKEAILRYGAYRDQCTYPDVTTMLNELILRHQRIIHLLDETKALLKSKFDVLTQIQEGFET